MNAAAPAGTVRCPAKVNLALRVLRRRPDDYHELDTVFQAIDLWDELSLWPDSRLSLRCSDPRLPADESNLVLRAARLLRERHGRDGLGGRLRLDKHIPAGAGLGGGSSDAAGALVLCARHWRLRLPAESLLELARELGADVPFFLVGGTARGTGRGDCIEALPPLPEVCFLLGIPPLAISTAEVFRALPSKLTLPGNGVNLPLFSAHKWPAENDFRFAINDLERVVFRRWPGLGRFRDALRDRGAVAALLSGSGSTVFAVFEDRARAEQAARGLAGQFGDWRLLPTGAVRGGVQPAPVTD